MSTKLCLTAFLATLSTTKICACSLNGADYVNITGLTRGGLKNVGIVKQEIYVETGFELSSSCCETPQGVQ